MNCPNCHAELVLSKGGYLVQSIPDVDVQMFDVKSSLIESIGYEPQKRILKIVMNRHTYLYTDVPMYEFTGILNAESKGIFYNENIKDTYRSWKLD